MYTMKEACELSQMSYETLKFYCNEGLVPDVKRNKNNHRVFSQNNIEWLNNLNCLRDCGMTLHEMRDYISLALEGESSIPTRQQVLDVKRAQLEVQIAKLQSSLEYIDNKQKFYQDVLNGSTDYFSLLTLDEEDQDK